MSVTELQTGEQQKPRPGAGQMSVTRLRSMKAKGEKIVMLTAYDYSTAKIADNAGIPLLLVGDSLGRVMLGYDSELRVTMDDMVHHTKAVARGVSRALVVGDMPFMSYAVSLEETMRNAARLMQEGGARSVKVEGVEVAPYVERLVAAGIPVMGHLGLTPQSINVIGGHKIQGKTRETAAKLLKDALTLEQAGCFAVVLELVPTPLAGLISRKLSIPTIGIGSGPLCDGQVQVVHDLLGWYPDFDPKHARKYTNMSSSITTAFTEYMNDVKAGTFPGEENSFPMDEALLEGLE